MPSGQLVVLSETLFITAAAAGACVCRTPYRLARYNEPWLPLPFRRNEVLIDLQDFRWI